MNLPVGEVISGGINFKEIDIKRLVEGLFEKKFSGYLVVTLEGSDGIEEGVLLFKAGELNAAFYDYDLQGLTVFGDSALPHVFNSFAAEFITGDVVSLSNQQVDLVTAFNDKAKLERNVSKNEISQLIPKIFSAGLANKVLNQDSGKEESKSDIFKKLGLSGLE